MGFAYVFLQHHEISVVMHENHFYGSYPKVKRGNSKQNIRGNGYVGNSFHAFSLLQEKRYILELRLEKNEIRKKGKRKRRNLSANIQSQQSSVS